MLIFQPDRELLHRFVAKHAPTMRGKILDIGGGNRRYASLFTNAASFETLDIDPLQKPDIVASVESLPIADATYDGLLCTQVLGDVWDIRRAIGEMVRVLKPGGFLLITESLFNEEHDAPQDFWRFTQYALRKLLEPSCEIRALEARGGYFSQRAQQAIRYRIEKYDLYHRPILGRLAHVWALAIGRIAIARDRRDRSDANQKFPIGYCLLACKRTP
ncbi:class I SAM-dependent methyltransferase [Candidatus Peregrinibacteria bacterium]|nr:class I SAM-dependent methyltransferase [Candidatus Peregrinibacteria bacterium]